MIMGTDRKGRTLRFEMKPDLSGVIIKVEAITGFLMAEFDVGKSSFEAWGREVDLQVYAEQEGLGL